MSGSFFLESSRIKVAPFSDKHLTGQYLDWLNDPEIMRYSEQRFIRHTIESCRNYMNSFTGTENGFWAIEEKYKQKHIGTLTTYVNQRHGVATMGILIGDKHLRGQGYGAEVWHLMCDYLFDVIKVRKITAGTLSINYPMLQLMEKTGMVDDGIRVRECIAYNGAVVDIVFKALFQDVRK